ncbi:unnamed protein product [Aphanomyces euteiches]
MEDDDIFGSDDGFSDDGGDFEQIDRVWTEKESNAMERRFRTMVSMLEKKKRCKKGSTKDMLLVRAMVFNAESYRDFSEHLRFNFPTKPTMQPCCWKNFVPLNL